MKAAQILNSFGQPILIGLVCAGLQTSAPAKDFLDELHKTYPLKADGQVQLDNVNGKIRIVAWERAEVQLDAVKRAGTRQDLENLAIEINSQPDRLTVHTKYPRRTAWRWKGPSASIDYELKVPAGARLDKIESVNGSIEIENVEGEIHASGVNGRITAKGVCGSCRLETVNGRIEAAFTSLEHAHSVSLKAVNGKVDLTIPRTADAQVHASTVNGSIAGTSDLKAVKNWPVGSHLNGQLGKGSTKVKIETVNGSIRVQQSEAAQSGLKQS
jgi:hypothetical protein